MALEHFRKPAVRKALLLMVLLAVLWRVAQSDLTRLLKNDFVPYWIAARLMISGANPYDANQVFELEKRLHLDSWRPWIMWNPPWALTVVAPFGLLPFQPAAIAWFLLQFTIVFASSLWLWRIYQGPPRYRWLAIVLPGIFLPIGDVLLDSQITPVVLLGLVAFLYLVSKGKYLPAGFALALLALKPHLGLPLACACLLWCVRERRWQLLAGSAAGFAVLLLPVWIRPGLMAQYLHAMPTIWGDAAPAWGGVLRAIFGYGLTWLQYVPVVPGIVWAVFYWWRNRSRWNWKQHLPMLLLVGLITMPFGWTYDEVLLLPVFISAAVCLLAQDDRRFTYRMAAFYVAMNVVMFTMNVFGLRDHWYLWNVPLWLVAYVIVMRKRTGSTSPGDFSTPPHLRKSVGETPTLTAGESPALHRFS